MSTLFVSDLHLDPARPEILAAFDGFIAREAVAADALYILGDLFEAWIGDDSDDAIGQRFVAAMQPLRDAGKPVFFMHGNRDFLLGERYAHAAGMCLLPEGSLIDLHGTPTLLMHGDSLCIDDKAYQTFRLQSRSAPWQRAFLERSIAEREGFARQAREESQRHTGNDANAAIMDVNSDAVAAAMRTAGVRRLIHGHTHRPAVHRFLLDGEPAERIVLTDWYETGGVLRVDRQGAFAQSLQEQPPL
jgi:UDP-2,3-diacylglucosamine hydrolase